MKNKKFILGTIFGLLIGSSITAYAAYKYQATEVGYTPSNSNFEVDNVNDAIKELYEKHEKTSGATYIAPKEGETHKGIVYLDPTNLDNTCDENNSVSTTGRKTGCMKWYIYSEGDKSYALILDHNTTAIQQWYSSAINVNYEDSLVKPVVDKLVLESGWKVTPRLITAEEIKTITGNSSFSLTTASEYCLGNNAYAPAGSNPCPDTTSNRRFAWLFDYTYNCTVFGCNNDDNSTEGYWTSTPIGEASKGTSVWRIAYVETFGFYGPYLNTNNANLNVSGIRPVITIPKNIIK